MKLLAKIFGRGNSGERGNLEFLNQVFKQKGERALWTASPLLLLFSLNLITSYPTQTFKDPLSTNPIYSSNNS